MTIVTQAVESSAMQCLEQVRTNICFLLMWVFCVGKELQHIRAKATDIPNIQPWIFENGRMKRSPSLKRLKEMRKVRKHKQNQTLLTPGLKQSLPGPFLLLNYISSNAFNLQQRKRLLFKPAREKR